MLLSYPWFSVKETWIPCVTALAVILHNVMIHIIPMEKESEADEPLLWNISGQLLPIVLPYKCFLRLSIPWTSHSLKFHKFGHHIFPIWCSNHPISYPYMGHSLPYQTHTFALVRVKTIFSYLFYFLISVYLFILRKGRRPKLKDIHKGTIPFSKPQK